VAVPVRQLATLPDSVDSLTAAALPLAGLTALRLVRGVGALAGRRILLTGAAGGVGHLVTEFASAAGADITVVVASAERGQRLLELGAARAVVSIDEAPETVDVVLESVGGASLDAALSRLAPRGLMIWFGQAGRVPATIDFFAFFNRHQSATIRHFDYADSDVPDGVDLATLVRLTHAGRLHPEIGIVSSWSDTAARISDLRARRIRGKAILQLDPRNN
jgi:NADPH:quinone reductase-like Zn-dependent oxidoreductase